MDQGFTFISSRSSLSSSTCYTPDTKSDIIAFAIGNPANKSTAKLSKTNENLLGSGMANLLAKRHNHELQRCSQFYSLASVFNETTTKDKHRMKSKNMEKMHSARRKYILRLFVCF